MSYVTVIWSVIASGSLLLALMYGCVWLLDRQAKASLAFAFECLSIVGAVIVELGLMHSSTPEEWGEWVRWNQVPILLRTTALVAFIWFYFGTGRPWLMAAVIGSRLVIAVTGFIVDPNFNFSSIESIDRIEFLGEQVTIVGRATASPYQWFATLAAYLVLAFVLDASFTLWKQNKPDARRKVLVIGGATLLSWTVGVTYTQLMVYGDVRLPALLSPPYLVMLAAMTIELSRDTLRASRLSRELRESEARLEFAAAAAGFGIWIWDVEKKRIWATNTAREMFNVGPGEVLEVERLRTQVHDDDLPSMRRVLAEATITGEERELHFRICAPAGGLRWILAHGRAESDRRGRVAMIRGVLRDVTEQVRTRQENEELRRDLAHAGRVSVLGTLSSSLAHELGQPLGAIALNAEVAEMMLRDGAPDLAELREILADIRRDDRRASEVIDRLRSLLKRRQLDLLPLSVTSLVQETAALLRSDAIARNVVLEVATDAELPVIRGDKVHLSQVLINLVVNAMDAVADQPAPRRKVILHARAAEAGWVEVVVTDAGHGISAEAADRLFDPFFTTKENGMGMGLSVSRTIVQAHGGRITAENSPDGGAVFRVMLPVFTDGTVFVHVPSSAQGR
jgi:signal transduction histidine kinase